MSEKKSVIIGINWEQNSTAALMIGGKIAGCVSEERFTRIKNDERYPIKSINWLLNSNGLTKKDVTDVCFISKDWSPTYSLVRHYTNFKVKDYLEYPVCMSSIYKKRGFKPPKGVTQKCGKYK